MNIGSSPSPLAVTSGGELKIVFQYHRLPVEMVSTECNRLSKLNSISEEASHYYLKNKTLQ
jgi:hypothetical protein